MADVGMQAPKSETAAMWELTEEEKKEQEEKRKRLLEVPAFAA